MKPLYPADPILRAQRKLYLEKFKDLGLYLFRGTLSKNEEKKRRDFKQIEHLLSILEDSLNDSPTEYLFGESHYTFVDIALMVHVERLFFFKNSKMGTIVNFNFLEDFPNVQKWVENLKARSELSRGLTDETQFTDMIKDFFKSGKWGLKYPLAKM